MIPSKMNPQVFIAFLTGKNDSRFYFLIVDLIFNIDFVDINFVYTYDHQTQNFLINELLQIC